VKDLETGYDKFFKMIAEELNTEEKIGLGTTKYELIHL